MENKKDNVIIEFCEKFKWEIKPGIFDADARFLYITNNTERLKNYKMPSEDITLLTKNVKNNKYLTFSYKTFGLFNDVLKINLDEIIKLKRAIGGVYVEYFNNMLWITNSKGFRQPIKLGKLLRAINPDFTDKQVSDFVDIFNRYHDYDLSCVQISDNISGVYNYGHENSGSIGGSCMRGCGDYFESLEESCSTLKIAYIKDTDEYLIGRALLWEAYDKEGTLYKIMDRIYYDCEKTKILLEKYAEANGYYFRKEASGYCSSFYNPSNKELVELKLKVELKYSLMATYTPYMDTFRYYNNNNNTLYNYKGASYTNELTNTDGNSLYHICDICGGSCNEDDLVYSDYHSERICSCCLDDYRYVESRNDYIHEDVVIQLRDTDTYFLDDDSSDLVWVEDRQWYDYADNVYFVVDTGEYYEDTDELYFTEDTCEWYSSNLYLFEYDGFYYSERQEDLEQQEKEEEK